MYETRVEINIYLKNLPNFRKIYGKLLENHQKYEKISARLSLSEKLYRWNIKMYLLISRYCLCIVHIHFSLIQFSFRFAFSRFQKFIQKTEIYMWKKVSFKKKIISKI